MIHPFKTIAISSFPALQPIIYASNSTRNPAGEPGKRTSSRPILLQAAGSLALGCLACLVLSAWLTGWPGWLLPRQSTISPAHQILYESDHSLARSIYLEYMISKGKSPCLPSH
jgi:hypothetical protein